MAALRTALTSVCLAGLASALLLAGSTYVPQRVVGANGRFSDFETLLADVARADVVFVGEVHDDINTHRVELALFEGLAARRNDVVLAMEMFERDVQEPLAHFLMGHTDEADFLKEARPWPNYARDYKSLVDFAMSKNWPIVAANVPRSIATDVSQSGLDALGSMHDSEKASYAAEVRCPPGDPYAKRFVQAMGRHVAGSTGPTEPTVSVPGDVRRYYEAQCLKDETMGESIARAYTASALGGKRPLVLSLNGAFHSDYRQGTVERTARRLPGKRIVVLTILAVPDLQKVTPEKDLGKRADYAIYTLREQP